VSFGRIRVLNSLIYLTNEVPGIVSEPRAVATGSRRTLKSQRDFLIRSLPLSVLTRDGPDRFVIKSKNEKWPMTNGK
jgi:hypothetical protein